MNKGERQKKEASIAKCHCGNNLSVVIQEAGGAECPKCQRENKEKEIKEKCWDCRAKEQIMELKKELGELRTACERFAVRGEICTLE